MIITIIFFLHKKSQQRVKKNILKERRKKRKKWANDYVVYYTKFLFKKIIKTSIVALSASMLIYSTLKAAENEKINSLLNNFNFGINFLLWLFIFFNSMISVFFRDMYLRIKKGFFNKDCEKKILNIENKFLPIMLFLFLLILCFLITVEIFKINNFVGIITLLVVVILTACWEFLKVKSEKFEFKEFESWKK